MTPKRIKLMQDQTFIHRAHLTFLTTQWVDGEFIYPSVAAQCTGRIGWDWKVYSHPFTELYRGHDDAEAQRLCDEHNTEFHLLANPVGETK